MTVYVCLSADGTAVVGQFARPQNEPVPTGYAEIDDSDARFQAWLAENQPTG